LTPGSASSHANYYMVMHMSDIRYSADPGGPKIWK